MNFKHVNKLFTLIIGYYKSLKEPSYETQSYYNSQFYKRKICIEGDSSGSKGTHGPVLHSYIWMAYSCRLVCPVAWAGVLLIDKKTSVKCIVIINNSLSLLTVNYFVKLACADIIHCWRVSPYVTWWTSGETIVAEQKFHTRIAKKPPFGLTPLPARNSFGCQDNFWQQ
jgi:hypothetical protein